MGRSAAVSATLLCFLAWLACVAAQLPTSSPKQCSARRKKELRVPLSVKNVHWGYWWKGSRPKAYVQSGETFTLEMATHLAGDAPELMIDGDPAIGEIYKWDKNGQNIKMRGATGKGDGKHVLTGPIFLCGAEPGDVIEAQILELKPRKNPKTGRAYGSNGGAQWGYQYRTGFQDGFRRDVSTIYELFTDAKGYMTYAEPVYQWRLRPNPAKDFPGFQSPSCIPTTGSTPDSLRGQTYNFNSSAQTFSGNPAPCINGTNTIGGYWYIGQVYRHPLGDGTVEDYSVKGKWRVPANPHVGNMGLASDFPVPVTSTVPSKFGGNMDHKRLGPGSKFYMPVEVNGGLFQAGDCHGTQGDSEYDGTGLETSFTGKFRLILHKKAKLPSFIPQPFETPILENDKEVCWHGFTYNDYLRDLPKINATADPQALIGTLGYNTTLAMLNAANVSTRGVIKYFGVSEDAAHSIMTLGCDFDITQLVDTNLGYHVCCYKFVGGDPQYTDKCKRYNPPTFLPPGPGAGGKCKKTPYRNYYHGKGKGRGKGHGHGGDD